jgi:hypothetical protein
LADEAAGAVTEPRRFHENEDERQQALSQRVVAAREALAKPCGCKLRSERDAYRIEADEAMRDYEALEMDVRDVLGAIANPRPNQPFDPWARDTAQQALDRLDGDD